MLNSSLVSNALAAKLRRGAILDTEDGIRLDALVSSAHQIGAHVDLAHENDVPDAVRLVTDGFACRYKVLPDGRRQIVAYMLPGDFCDLHVPILGQMDHSIATLSACTVVDIPHEEIEELTAKFPRIARALWWATLVDEAILREWLVNVGQRQADRALAHLLCELMVRLETVGRVSGNSFRFPITQVELADTLGITAVHVNRVMQQLRRDGLIATQGAVMTIPDPDRLIAFSQFDTNYLHLGAVRPGQNVRSV